MGFQKGVIYFVPWQLPFEDISWQIDPSWLCIILSRSQFWMVCSTRSLLHLAAFRLDVNSENTAKFTFLLLSLLDHKLTLKTPKPVRWKSQQHSLQVAGRQTGTDRCKIITQVQVETVMPAVKQNGWTWKSSEKFMRNILPHYLWACSKEWVQHILLLCVALF